MNKFVLIFFLSFLFFFSINTEGIPTTGTFTPIYDLMLSNPDPSNNSINIGFNVTISIDCNSSTSNIMNLSWYEQQNSGWVLVQQNLSINNGTYRYIYSNATEYNTWYYWKIVLSDGIGHWYNRSFCFLTVPLEFGFTYSVSGQTITVKPFFGYGTGDFRFVLKGDNHTISETSWIPVGDISSHDFYVPFGNDYVVYLFYKTDSVTKVVGKTIGVGSARGANVDVETSEDTLSTIKDNGDGSGFKNLFDEVQLNSFSIVLIIGASVLVIMFLFKNKTKKVLFIRSVKNYGRKRK